MSDAFLRPHLGPGAGHELIVFRSTFPDPRFVTVGPDRHLIAGQSREQFATRSAVKCMWSHREIRPRHERIDSAFEAEAFDGNVVSDRGFEQQGGNQVIRDGVHPKFALDHFQRQTAQDIQREIDFDLPEVQFGLPALALELGNGPVRKLFLIEQRGHDHHMVAAKIAQ